MRAAWIAMASMAALVAAGPAQASTTWESGDTLYYVGSEGEINNAAINLQGVDATIQESSYAPIGFVAPCRPWSDMMVAGSAVFCPAAPVMRLVVDLGDSSDSLSAGAMSGSPLPTFALGGAGHDRLWSGFGNDDLTGGPGEDVITSYVGRDLIDAGDGETDTVDCGDGEDIAIVDPIDDVANCETTLEERPDDRPAPTIPATPQPTGISTHPAHPAPGTAPPPTVTPPAGDPDYVDPLTDDPPDDVHLKLVVNAVPLRMARTAGLPVKASCGPGCRVTAVARVGRARARRLGLPRTLARSSRTTAANGTTRLRMRLRDARVKNVRRLHITIHAEAITAAGQHLFQDVSLTLRR